jgi:hypothetical protein
MTLGHRLPYGGPCNQRKRAGQGEERIGMIGGTGRDNRPSPERECESPAPAEQSIDGQAPRKGAKKMRPIILWW